MSFTEDFLIENENRYKSVCLITDDHRYHIRRHLLYAWKPRVFFHILQHVRLMRAAKRSGIPVLRIDDVLKALKSLK